MFQERDSSLDRRFRFPVFAETPENRVNHTLGFLLFQSFDRQVHGLRLARLENCIDRSFADQRIGRRKKFGQDRQRSNADLAGRGERRGLCFRRAQGEIARTRGSASPVAIDVCAPKE